MTDEADLAKRSRKSFAVAKAYRRRTEKVEFALAELSRQVRESNAVDDHGHRLVFLQALFDADYLLARGKAP